MMQTWYGPRRTVLATIIFAIVASGAQAADPCGVAGQWFDPERGAALDSADVIGAMASHRVVLLGEVHDQIEHHRWQLHTLLALHGREPSLAIGLEMLPRSAQGVLDDWVAGKLSADELLRQSRWSEVWGFDAEMYLPIFHFARQHRVPMIALNVERALISRVADDGWQAVPKDLREGVGDPSAASDDYRDALAQIFVLKARLEGGDAHDMDPPTDAERRAIEADPGFQNFVEAQLTWDRAMAEAIAGRLNAPNSSVKLVVALVGRGHAEFGYGIPYQLADLGVSDAAVLLPTRPSCDAVTAGVADAVFGIGDWREPVAQGPRLGVLIASDDGGVLIQQVSSQSVAEATGLAQGDVIVEAAGVPIAETGELITIVQRQAPGTWLPLVVRRDSEQLDFVAKFPTTF